MKILVKYGLDDKARIDLLADSSILPNGRPLFVPDWATDFVGTLCAVFRVNRLGKCVAPRFAHRYWDALAAGLLTHGVDAAGQAIADNALTRAHDGALVLGQMVNRDSLPDSGILQWTVSNTWQGQLSLEGLIDHAESTLSLVSQYMTLKMGDLLCLCSDVSHSLPIDLVTTVSLQGSNLLQTKIK